jgi:hypothetical protein
MSTEQQFDRLLELTYDVVNTFKRHFSQIHSLFESSDPMVSQTLNEQLAQFEKQKNGAESRVNALPSISELEWADRLKLGFQLIQLIEKMQRPIFQMRAALDDTYVQSSLASSEYSYLKQSVDTLRITYEKYMHQFQTMYDTAVERLSHDIFEGVSGVDKKHLDQIEEMYVKYNVVGFYSHVLKYILGHYKASELLQRVELLKDQLLETEANEKHSHEWRSFQAYDLMPDGPYRSLKEVLNDIDANGLKVSDLTNIAKKLSTKEAEYIFIVLTRPTSVTYNPWNIADAHYMNEHNMSVDPSRGVTVDTLNTFETIEELPSKGKKPKSNLQFYPVTKSKSTKKRYYVLETYDGEHFRILTPWNIFPMYQSAVKYVTSTWISEIENPKKRQEMYPSARVGTYNKILEEKIMQNKQEEEEIVTESRDISKERGYLSEKSATWFNQKTKSKNPKNVGEYRDLINGDEFRGFLEKELVNLLSDQYKLTKNVKNSRDREMLLTVMSVSSSVASRISREILGITTKTGVIQNMFGMYGEDKLLYEIQTIFKQHIRQAVDVVMNYQSVCSVLDKKTIIMS